MNILSLSQRSCLRVIAVALLCGNGFGSAGAAVVTGIDRVVIVRHQMDLLNAIPEKKLSEKRDPGLAIIKKIYDADGPDFLTLRKLLSQAAVRAAMNPSTRVVLAGIVSQRWDTFSICGNLWLAGLKSPNPELRDKSRRRIVSFIQPGHLPPLIELLTVPGANVMAYEVLQEITGQNLSPDVKVWRAWYKKHPTFDVVGHLIADTKEQLAQHPIEAFDQDKLWYAPKAIDDTQTALSSPSTKEEEALKAWRAWTSQDVRRYVDEWAAVKPIIDRLSHQPDPRISRYFEKLASDPGYGDYTCVVLGWRANAAALSVIQNSYDQNPTAGRALARGALGDKTALRDLLKIIDKHPYPLTFPLMDDDARQSMKTLHTVGVIPAEQAFELLSHKSFDFESATTKSDKKKALKKANRWYKDNSTHLALDKRRGYYNVAS